MPLFSPMQIVGFPMRITNHQLVIGKEKDDVCFVGTLEEQQILFVCSVV